MLWDCQLYLIPVILLFQLPTKFALFSTLGQEKSNWWFGGGYDLTPYFGFIDDSVNWHRSAKKHVLLMA